MDVRLPIEKQRRDTVHVAGAFLFFSFVISCSALHASWPVDSEPYGFLGCKLLQFRGFWEYDMDSSRIDESTDAVCISVAISNILLYYLWPPVSEFDGYFMDSPYSGMVKRINHRWNYKLITGPRTTSDCESDDPESRYLPNNPGWTGVSEIRKLVYVAERSFGYNHELIKNKDTTACEGEGYYPIEHVLRNRFGYPLCATIDAKIPASKRIVLDNLRQRMPVIAMRCDHIYLLDGFKYDSLKKRYLIHSTDYVQGEDSMGWFPWKFFFGEGLDRFVVNITPRYRLSPGPSRGKIVYSWGEGIIAGTSYTSRKARVVLLRENRRQIGSVELSVRLQNTTPFSNKESRILYRFNGTVSKPSMVIPPKGYLKFDVDETADVELVIRNNDPYAKNFRIVFHDFVDKKSKKNAQTHNRQF
ncbi:MAG: hypothetical protein JXA71_04035 [Chitinispirillaceae bacterium]|nr:hypothetical protein [Chitinispirillaceae bacterium]